MPMRSVISRSMMRSIRRTEGLPNAINQLLIDITCHQQRAYLTCIEIMGANSFSKHPFHHLRRKFTNQDAYLLLSMLKSNTICHLVVEDGVDFLKSFLLGYPGLFGNV